VEYRQRLECAKDDFDLLSLKMAAAQDRAVWRFSIVVNQSTSASMKKTEAVTSASMKKTEAEMKMLMTDYTCDRFETHISVLYNTKYRPYH
jgi:hypothetical protein